VWTGGGGWVAVCVRPLAHRQHAAGVAWRVGAGDSAMASEANDRLCEAAYRGDVAGIAAALLAGADPNAFEGTYGDTPLLRAAHNGHVAAIAALLASGARVDGCDYFGCTPLVRAASRGDTATVDALLAAGADVQHESSAGHTALHCAAMWGRLDAARLLLEAGARTDVCTIDGERPINMVRAPLARARQLAALLRHCEQVGARDEAGNLRALLTAAAPWSRRRAVAVACYGAEWEWEA
jgi:hypothetical protein